MRGNPIIFFVTTLAVTGLFGCASSGRIGSRALTSGRAPSAEKAITAGMPAVEAESARKLYVLKCAKCHAFYDPAQYSDPEWSHWMTRMSRKSRLNNTEETLLRRYLDYFRND